MSVDNYDYAKLYNTDQKSSNLYHIPNSYDEPLTDKLINHNKNHERRREKDAPSDLRSINQRMADYNEEPDRNGENFRLPDMQTSVRAGNPSYKRNHSLTGGMTGSQYDKLRNNGYLSGKFQIFKANPYRYNEHS
jgi:hypothetical protein